MLPKEFDQWGESLIINVIDHYRLFLHRSRASTGLFLLNRPIFNLTVQ